MRAWIETFFAAGQTLGLFVARRVRAWIETFDVKVISHFSLVARRVRGDGEMFLVWFCGFLG